ncbi:MAG: hypothetical protein JWM13_1181 [Arthrobacter sp.]|nr:hypothetical protein [Arthrobacter sp.]
MVTDLVVAVPGELPPPVEMGNPEGGQRWEIAVALSAEAMNEMGWGVYSFDHEDAQGRFGPGAPGPR